MRERVATTATSLLGLLGIDADPIKSREHILLSTIIDACWRQGQDLDLARLIQLIQTPPVQRIGVLELEAFYPSDKRFELAMAVNNLLAAPGFSAWMEGEPLDIQRLLYTPEGKPRLAILSIAHLNDAERMFFVSLLLNQVLGWMRQQPGTTSLRAIVYMDEIAGYLPPVANPASKAPMLTLLKQARAFGVGMVLATQNPVDLDYKALSNAGTWFIGRLQTERDQARVLDGLEGAMSTAGGAFDRAKLQAIIAGLGKRVFLLHNVHDDGPEVFESRWAMSYLRGPLTRTQIKTLMAGRKAAGTDEHSAEAPRAAPESTRHAAPGTHLRAPAPPAVSAHWVLPPGIPQYFAPARPGARYVPMIVGAANVRFTDTKARIDETRPLTVVTPLTDDPIPVNWEQAEPAGFDVGQLTTELPAGASFDELPGAAEQGEELRRVDQGVRDLGVHRRVARHLPQPVVEARVQRRRVRRRFPRAASAGRARAARRRGHPAAPEVRAEGRGAAGEASPGRAVGAKGTGTGIGAEDADGHLVRDHRAGRAVWPEDAERLDAGPRHHRRARCGTVVQGSTGRRTREGERRVGAGADRGAGGVAAVRDRRAGGDVSPRHRAARDDQPEAKTHRRAGAAGGAGLGRCVMPELKFGPTYVGVVVRRAEL